MPIEREECKSFFRDGMLQDDGRAVIERRIVVAEAVYDAVQWGQYWRARLHEQIKANMHRTPLWSIITRHFVLLARINRTRLIVPANAHAGPFRLHIAKNMAVERFEVGYLRHCAQLATAGTQIEDHRLVCTQVGFDHPPDVVSIVREPLYDGVAVGAGRQLACAPEGVISEPGMNALELFKQSPCWLFANFQVVVVRFDLLLVRRVDHADAQSHTDKWIKHVQFRLSKWECLVVAGDDCSGSRQGIC